MKNFIKLFALVAMASIVSWGCTPPEGGETPSNGTTTEQAHDHDGHEHADGDHAHADADSVVYCGKCGHTKGTEQCCAVDGEACAACEMHKGSALCCVTLGDDLKGKDLCGKCGHIAGSESCCAEGAAACEACGPHKGSPLCCKLEKAEEETEEEKPVDLSDTNKEEGKG